MNPSPPGIMGGNKFMKKKIFKPLVYKLILHPGEVSSKYDGDSHFISTGDLIRLYNILPTDIIRTYDPRNGIPLDRQSIEGWLNLYPKYHGDYHNIHELDQFQVKHPTKKSIADLTKFLDPNLLKSTDRGNL